MTKEQAMTDGKIYANKINAPIILQKRGKNYRAAQIQYGGWAYILTILPDSK